MFSTMYNLRFTVMNTSFTMLHSSNMSRTLFKPNTNVQKLLYRKNYITHRKDFLRMKVKNTKNNKNPHDIGFYGYFLLGIPITTFCLGTWQVQRLKWKTNLLTNLKERMSMPVVPLPDDLQDLEKMEYRKVVVRGKFLHEKEFTVGPRSLISEGKSKREHQAGVFSSNDISRGYYVITPFQLEDRDLTILVNRGWVPQNRKDPLTRQEAQIDDVVELTGIVRLNENRPQFVMRNDPKNGVWMYRDVYEMAKMTGAEPVYIDMVYENTIQGGPIGGQTRVKIRNEHLSYIITWYLLSAITAWMWFRQHVQKLPLK